MFMRAIYLKLLSVLLVLTMLLIQSCSSNEDESMFDSSKAFNQIMELKKLAKANDLQVLFSNESKGFSDEEYNELVKVIEEIGKFEKVQGKLYSELCSSSEGVMSSSKVFPVMRRDIENGQTNGKIKYQSVTFGVSVGWVTTPQNPAAISDVRVSASSNKSSIENVMFNEDPARREWSGWSDTYDGTMTIYGTLSYTVKKNGESVVVVQQMKITSKINSSSNTGDYSAERGYY